MGVKLVRVQPRRGSSAILPVPVSQTAPANYKTITMIQYGWYSCYPFSSSKQSCSLSHRRNDQRRGILQTLNTTTRCNRSTVAGNTSLTNTSKTRFNRDFQVRPLPFSGRRQMVKLVLLVRMRSRLFQNKKKILQRPPGEQWWPSLSRQGRHRRVLFRGSM